MIKNFFTAVLTSIIILFTVANQVNAAKHNSKSFAALVNDKMISKTDINNRIDMAILSSALDKNQQTYDYLYPLLLKVMIDEELQLQKTEYFKIHISDAEITHAIGNIEQRNNMPVGNLKEMFAAQFIPFESMERHIRASIAWRDYIRERFEPLIQVNDVEIDLFLHELETSKQEDQVLLAEIFLPFDSADSIEAVYQNTEKMVEKMRHGAHFSALAQEFSAASSASKGGDIGWIAPSRLDHGMQEAIKNLNVGQLTNPIQTKNGYYILMLRDRRSAGESISKDSLVSFVQVLLSLAPNSPENEIKNAILRIKNLSDNATSCDMMQTLTRADKLIQIQKIQQASEREMPSELKGVLQSLDIGQASKPILSDMGVMAFMICQKEDINPQEPSRDEVRAILTERKLASIAEREIRGMRRSAHVVIGQK